MAVFFGLMVLALKAAQCSTLPTPESAVGKEGYSVAQHMAPKKTDADAPTVA